MQTAISTGTWLRELREDRGLSPEEVPHAMLRAGIERRSIPSARTVRRCEHTGRMPHVRYAFGIAQFYGVPMAQLWPVRERVLA
ncbi:MAG: helix-turn-helix domain-containing protein [Acidiferrobacteraceae bacterium]